jgi:hypothetical protein
LLYRAIDTVLRYIGYISNELYCSFSIGSHVVVHFYGDASVTWFVEV